MLHQLRGDFTDPITFDRFHGLVPMEKTINCSNTNCRARLKITGPVQNKKEDMDLVTCPVCGTPNEVSWPVFAGTRTVEVA